MNPKITAALALPVMYASVDLVELANLNLEGMGPNFGTLDEETGAESGNNPTYHIYGKIIRGEAVTETELAYLEYTDRSRTSPYRWNGDTNTFTFDPSLVGEHLADAQVHDEPVTTDSTVAVVDLSAPVVETPVTPIASAPSAVAATTPPVTDIPFPHDLGAVHPIDAHSVNTIVTKTSDAGYSVAHGQASGTPVGTLSDGNPIASGDALAHLPVGTKIVIGEDGATKVALSLPAKGLRGAVVTFSHNLHSAIANVWNWLVAEGSAVIADVEKVL